MNKLNFNIYTAKYAQHEKNEESKYALGDKEKESHPFFQR